MKISRLKLMILFYVLFWMGGLNYVFANVVHIKYLTMIYFIFLCIYIFWRKSIPFFKNARLFKMYLLMLCIVFVFHINQTSSMINILSLFIPVLSIAIFARLTVLAIPSPDLERFFVWVFSICLIFNILLSCFLTSINFPFAPDYYFWESFYTEKRLLLIRSDSGLSAIIGISAFLGVFLIATQTNSGKNKMLRFIYIILITFLLIGTKSRTALLIALLIVGGYLSALFKDECLMLYARVVTVLFSLMLFLYILFPFAPGLYNYTFNFVLNLQEKVPNVRIISSDHADSLGSGREILNHSLITTSMEKPLMGHGKEAPILLYGVDAEGNVSFDEETKIASSESSFRFAVKYGWPIYFSMLFLILSPIISYMFLGNRKIHAASMLLFLVILLNFIFNGVFENYYASGPIFLYLLLIYYFKKTYKLTTVWTAPHRLDKIC